MGTVDTQRAKRKRKLIFLDHLYKTLIFLAAIVIVVSVFPETAKYKYSFEIGKPWQYSLLTATFDFPIYKSETELKEERDAVTSTFIPYFDINQDTERRQIEKLNARFWPVDSLNHPDTHTQQRATALQYLKKQLHVIYKAGLLQNQDYSLITERKADHIIITEDNLSRARQVTDVYSRASAMEMLQKHLPSSLDWNTLCLAGLSDYLDGNLVYDSNLTNAVKTDELNNISITSGLVQTGERIIDRGEIVTEQKYRILDSLRRETEQRENSSFHQKLLVLGGQILLTGGLFSLFFMYIFMFRRNNFFRNNRYLSLMISLMVAFVVITAMLTHYAPYSTVYLIPYALLPIIIGTFADSRTALFAHLITMLFCSLLVPAPHEFLLLEITAGMTAVYYLRDIDRRSQLAKIALLITSCYCIIYSGFVLIHDSSMLHTRWWLFGVFCANGILLLLAYPFIYLTERIFGFTSTVSLMELCNSEQPLLRLLSEKAPGTYQHVTQVANLAAYLSMHLHGAKPMLARAGALYHDIGKLKNPAYFVENQTEGKQGRINPHAKLTAVESAAILLKHVPDGVTLAKEYNLPRNIIEFIETHHGKSQTRYFYTLWMNEHPNEEPDTKLFTYPGPNPYTKEQAIVMICDSVEAASRSMTEHTSECIDAKVEDIVNNIAVSRLLDNAPLTLQELRVIKSLLKERLKDMYHTRIVYPTLNTEVNATHLYGNENNISNTNTTIPK